MEPSLTEFPKHIDMKFTKFLPIIIVVLICIPVVLPYFQSGYFPTHDGQWAVVRLGDMFRQLRDLQIPPRMSGALNFGYGYPLFNYTYPFPYYLGILLYVPLHSFILSIKLIFILSVFISAIGMYVCSYKLWKDRSAGVVASILYIYLPYRMVDLYVRGSIGESLSFALFPLIFYLVLRLFDNAFGRATVVLLSLLIGTLVMTHNIMAVLFFPLLITFAVARIIREKRFDVAQSLFLCFLLGAGVSFFFWFPALFEKGNILLSKIPIADRQLYFVKPLSLILPSWGYQPPTEVGGFSYQIGISQIISVLLTLIIIIYTFVKNKLLLTPAKYYALIISVCFLISLLMLFPFTDFVWKHTPLLKEINYPWTLLAPMGFLSSLLAGFLIIQGKYLKYFGFILAFLSVILTIQYAHPQSFVDHSDNYYLTNEATTTSSNELMPLWVKEQPNEHFKEKVVIKSGSAQISNISTNSKFLKFNYKSIGEVTFRINTIYYPGWNAYVNGERAKINYDNNKGVMEISSNQYRDTVSLYFNETFPRVIADTVTVLSLFVILFILLRPILLFKS